MSLRSVLIGTSLAAFSVVAIAAPASADYRRRNDDAAAAAAIGIGALIVGGIIANQSHRQHRDRDDNYRAPRHSAPVYREHRQTRPYYSPNTPRYND
jgi:hypothetical protein